MTIIPGMASYTPDDGDNVIRLDRLQAMRDRLSPPGAPVWTTDPARPTVATCVYCGSPFAPNEPYVMGRELGTREIVCELCGCRTRLYSAAWL